MNASTSIVSDAAEAIGFLAKAAFFIGLPVAGYCLFCQYQLQLLDNEYYYLYYNQSYDQVRQALQTSISQPSKPLKSRVMRIADLQKPPASSQPAASSGLNANLIKAAEAKIAGRYSSVQEAAPHIARLQQKALRELAQNLLKEVGRQPVFQKDEFLTLPKVYVRYIEALKLQETKNTKTYRLSEQPIEEGSAPPPELPIEELRRKRLSHLEPKSNPVVGPVGGKT